MVSTPEPAPTGWRPAPAEGQWLPPGTPGSNWTAPAAPERAADEYVGRRRAPEPETIEPPRRGRHYADTDEPSPAPTPTPAPTPRHAGPESGGGRRRRADDTDTAGQSVAELLARLQANPTPGGRRRRREE